MKFKFLPFLLISAFAFSQTKVGTTVGQFLLIEPSSKITAMGNAGVSIYDEYMSAYYNPASLGMFTTSGFQLTHALWLADIKYDYFIASVKAFKNSSIAISITFLNSGEIDVRTVEQPLGTGERYSVKNFAVGLIYGHRLFDRLSAGLSLSYIQETIWHSSLWAVAFNFGILYKLTESGLYLGASLSNFGTRGKYRGWDLRIRYDQDPSKYGDNSNLPAELFTEEFPLPIVFRVGLSYPLKLIDGATLKLTADAFHPSDNTESLSFGGELSFWDMFFVRSGYQYLFQKDSETGLTAGIGVNYSFFGVKFKFDYAWAEHGRLGSVQRFSFGLNF